ncbi:MAG: OmpH family outer membrane protein [Candidatus Melainabacteria bacterium]|nr:OmpH family outer membrane protein [Candidatus Melainabacteria bacterium]
MKMRIVASVCASLLLVVGGGLPGQAEKIATPTQIKIGYFNLALVKASYPEAAGSETLRTNAESQLRRDVEEGNKRLQKGQEEKKPREELEKMARELQAEINAKQQALIQLVQTQAAIATQNIAQAVNSVARDKSLDLVVDGAGVFAGGDKIVNNGLDITEEVVKRLQPQALRPTTSGATGGASAPITPASSGGGK